MSGPLIGAQPRGIKRGSQEVNCLSVQKAEGSSRCHLPKLRKMNTTIATASNRKYTKILEAPSYLETIENMIGLCKPG
jgi:hypothetical protein